MMIKAYMVNEKRFFEVYVAKRGANRKIVARRKRGIKNEREAKSIELELMLEVGIAIKRGSVETWGNWKEEVLQRVKERFKNSTYGNYSAYISNWVPEEWNSKPLDEIKPKDVFQVIDKSKSKLSQVSQLTFLKILRRVFQEAVNEGVIPFNPARGVVIKVPESNKSVLNTTEVDILLRQAKDLDHRFYPIWCFAVQTGMRSGEMYGLLWKDVDFERNQISVNKQWTRRDGIAPTKSRENRVVPISQDLRAFLLNLRQQNPHAENVLPHLAEWTHGDQAKIIREFCRMIGITEVKFHDLRATFITNMLSQGVPLAKVMSIVGHKKMDTTNVYLRLAGVDVKGATDALSYSLPEDIGEGQLIAVNFPKKKK